MIKSGALAPGNPGMFIHGDTSGLRGLLSKGLVFKMDGATFGHPHDDSTENGWYTCTESGKKHVNYSLLLGDAKSILQFKRKCSFEERTAVELIQYLTSNGWKDSLTRRPKSLSPYKLGGDKIWYRLPGKVVNIHYLRALAKSDELLRSDVSGLVEIVHCQSKAYYSAILKGFNPAPNQPLPYYQLLCNRKTKPVAVTCDDIAVVELSFLVLYWLTFFNRIFGLR